MLKKFDGRYINPNHLAMAEPYEMTGSIEGWRIKFHVPPENRYGNTLYKNEEECEIAIDKIVNGRSRYGKI